MVNSTIGNWHLAIGCWQLTISNWQLAISGHQLKINSKSEILNPKRNYKSQILNPKRLEFRTLEFRILFRISNLGFRIF